jgi:hypothetical protein
MNDLTAHGRTGLTPLVSYARISEDVRQRDGHGVRHQLLINERTAWQYGCRIVATYHDNGCSASKEGADRPGFDSLVADLGRGYTDTGQSRGWSASRMTACTAARRT